MRRSTYLVQCFRNLDLKSLPSRQLQCHGAQGHDRVQDLVAWTQSDHHDIVGQLGIILLDQRHGLVIDQCGVRVIDGTMSTDDQLMNLVLRPVLHHLPESCIALDDIGDTL